MKRAVHSGHIEIGLPKGLHRCSIRRRSTVRRSTKRALILNEGVPALFLDEAAAENLDDLELHGAGELSNTTSSLGARSVAVRGRTVSQTFPAYRVVGQSIFSLRPEYFDGVLSVRPTRMGLEKNESGGSHRAVLEDGIKITRDGSGLSADARRATESWHFGYRRSGESRR